MRKTHAETGCVNAPLSSNCNIENIIIRQSMYIGLNPILAKYQLDEMSKFDKHTLYSIGPFN